MITKPSSAQLIELVRGELHHTPELPAAEQRELLALADGLLGVAARRTTSESGWMVDEIAQIEELASFLLMNGHDPSGIIRDRYAQLVPVQDVHPANVAERYRESSALLADCVPLAMTASGEARERLDIVIDARVAHEREIRGDVALVRG